MKALITGNDLTPGGGLEPLLQHSIALEESTFLCRLAGSIGGAHSQKCAILAVGVGEKRPIVVGDQLAIASAISCKRSVDHRSVDSAVGAQLLSAFKSAIENPMLLLV